MGRRRRNLGHRAPRIWQVYSRDPQVRRERRRVFGMNQAVTSVPGGKDGNKGVGRHQVHEVQS